MHALGLFLLLGFLGVDAPSVKEPVDVVGIGAVVANHNGEAVVISVVDGGAAYNAGVRVDDKIIQIDDTRVENLKKDGNLELDKVVALIRGKAGTTVKIIVTRENEASPVTYKLTRAAIKLPKPSMDR